MSERRWLSPGLLIVCGIAAVGLGVSTALLPGLAGPAVGDSIVILVGLVALVGAARAAGDAWTLPRRGGELPDAHRTDAASVSGESFDRVLERGGLRGEAGRRSRERAVRHLRSVAVDVLVATTGDSAETVRSRLDSGTWTDDPAAAALFAEVYEPTWRDRLRRLLGRPTGFQRRVERAVTEVEKRAERPGFEP